MVRILRPVPKTSPDRLRVKTTPKKRVKKPKVVPIDPSQTKIFFQRGELKVKRPEKKAKHKSPEISTPKHSLPTPSASSECHVTVIPETPDSPKVSSTDSSSVDSEDFYTPVEGLSEMSTKRSFLERLSQSVEVRMAREETAKLEESCEIFSGKPRAPIVIISDDEDGCAEDTAIVISDNSSGVESPPEAKVKARRHERDFCRRVSESCSPRKRFLQESEASPVKPKKKTTPKVKKEGTSFLAKVKKEIMQTSTPWKEVPPVFSPNLDTTLNSPPRAALVRGKKKAKKVTTPKKSPFKAMFSPGQVIPETPFESPASVKKIESYFSSPVKSSPLKSSPIQASSPLSEAQTMSSPSDTQSVSSCDSPLSPVQDLPSFADLGDSPLSSVKDLELFSSPLRRQHMPRKAAKRMSTFDDSDIDNPLDDLDVDEFSESDDDFKMVHDNDDVQKRVDESMAKMKLGWEKAAAEKSSSGSTPRGGSYEPEDEVAVKYHAAQMKAAEREKKNREIWEAKQQEQKKREAEKRRLETMDTPLIECEDAGIQVFTYGIKDIKLKPTHELFQVMAEAYLRPSQVLPKVPVDLGLSGADAEWLLVKISRETVRADREVLISTLLKSGLQLERSQVDRVLEAIGFRYWDTHKGSLENKASAYSVLNMRKRTSGEMPITPRKGGVASQHCSPAFNPLMSFESPGLSIESPSKKVQPPPPPPVLRYRSSESLSDFFDTLARVITSDCVEFLFRVLLLQSTDSSLESLQSDTSPAYSAMARLLSRDYSILQAVELACDTVDLRSAQTRFLQVISGGTSDIMHQYAKTSSVVFFLKEYITDKTVVELAELGSTDKNIVTTVFFDNLNDFSSRSEKPSSFIRHVFNFFDKSMHLPSTLAWTAGQMRDIDVALKSRGDYMCELNDFKFNAMAMSWFTLVSNERVVVENANQTMF